MVLIRKLKTAASVLKSHGANEVAGLAKDNVINSYKRSSGAVSRAAKRLSIRVFPDRKRQSGRMHILYVSTEFEALHSQTVRYRVHNFRAALHDKADTCFELVEKTDDGLIAWADVVVLMRVTWTPQAQTVIDSAKRLSVPVVFDIDDIIFLPEYVPYYCRVLGDTSEENEKKRSGEFEGFEKTFRLCDYCTASTQYIADIMLKEGKCAFVIHNGLNEKQLHIASRSHRENGPRAIGYLSGTKTHDKDFLQALPALERIFSEYDDVTLRVAGYLDVSVLPEVVAARTEAACYMSWQRLMGYGARNYINIAPLDITNPFCHAKSELKFFEAAAVGVPTVASATDTFSRCIESGDNGMLASNDDEWYASIKALLDDVRLYAHVGKKAKAYALSHYSPDATAAEALAAYKNISEKHTADKDAVRQPQV